MVRQRPQATGGAPIGGRLVRLSPQLTAGRSPHARAPAMICRLDGRLVRHRHHLGEALSAGPESHGRIGLAAPTERSHSGLVQRFAKPPSGVTCFEGSNPSLSASSPIKSGSGGPPQASPRGRSRPSLTPNPTPMVRSFGQRPVSLGRWRWTLRPRPWSPPSLPLSVPSPHSLACPLRSALYVQSQAGKPKVRVVVKAAMDASGPRLGAPFVDITAQNRGPVPVTISSVGFDLAARGSTAPIVDARTITGERALPRPLQPGEAVSIVFDFLELARLDATNHVRAAFVHTAAGDRYTGRVKRSFIQSWARHAAEWDHDRA